MENLYSVKNKLQVLFILICSGIRFFSSTILFLLLILIAQSGQGQTAASATWALTSNQAAAISGAVTAGNATAGSSVTHWPTTTTCGTYGEGWSLNSTQVGNNQYAQFTISPATGDILTVTDFLVHSYATTSSGTCCPEGCDIAAYYSLNGFSTGGTLFTGTLGNQGDDGDCTISQQDNYPISGGVVVASGGTLTVRLYSFANNDNTDRFYVANVVISGTTIAGACTPPSLSTNPSTAAQNICLNGTATQLSVIASGTGPFTYQWYQNATNNNTSGTLITGATDSTYTPLTNTLGALYYYCIVGSACSPAATSNTSGLVTVANGTLTPTLYTVGGGGSYCSGGAGVPITLSGSQSGLDYQLQLNGANTGTPVVGPGSPFSFPAQTVSGTYTVIASGGCYMATAMTNSVVVSIVASAPSTPGAIAGPNTACSGDADTFSIAPVTGATSYVWTLPGGWTGSSVTDSISTIAASGGGTISVTAGNACGNSTAQTLTITTGPTPATPGTISGPSTACSGDLDTFSIAAVTGATSYTWTLPNGWTGNSTKDSISTVAAAGGGTISVTANNACGSSSARTLTISTGPTPATPGTISGPATACSGDLDTFSIAAVTGATSYTWTLPNGWTGSSTTDGINTVAAAGGGTISVTANNACGSSSARTLTISTGPTPATPGTISGPSTSCSGDLDTFSIAAVNGATSYTWTLPGGWTGSSTSNSINTVASAGGGTISVTANNACGSSSAQTLTVSQGATPATPGIISGPTSACSGDLDTFSVAAVNGATSYTWTLPGGWPGSSATNSISTVAGAGGGTISVTANNACGSSSAQTLTVIQGSTPATPGTITGSDIVCNGSAVAYSVALVNGATSYTWTLPNGWTGTSNTENINTTAGSAGTISVTANNACGSSTAQTLAVSLGSIPTTPGVIAGPDSICDGSTGAYSVDTVAGATSYVWTLPIAWTGTSTTNSINATGSTTSGNITVTAGNGCGQSSAQTKAVAINSNPVVTLNLSDSTVCNNVNPVLALSGGLPAGGTYSGQGVSGTNFDASSLNAGNYPVAYAYTSALGCAGSDTATVIVTVCSGIQNTTDAQITVYPNPFNDVLIINTYGNYGKGVVVLTDAAGRVISRTEFEAGVMNVQLNTNSITNGAYLLSVLVDGKLIAVRKLFRIE